MNYLLFSRYPFLLYFNSRCGHPSWLLVFRQRGPNANVPCTRHTIRPNAFSFQKIYQHHPSWPSFPVQLTQISLLSSDKTAQAPRTQTCQFKVPDSSHTSQRPCSSLANPTPSQNPKYLPQNHQPPLLRRRPPTVNKPIILPFDNPKILPQILRPPPQITSPQPHTPRRP